MEIDSDNSLYVEFGISGVLSSATSSYYDLFRQRILF